VLDTEAGGSQRAAREHLQAPVADD